VHDRPTAEAYAEDGARIHGVDAVPFLHATHLDPRELRGFRVRPRGAIPPERRMNSCRVAIRSFATLPGMSGLYAWLVGRAALARFGDDRPPSLPFAIGTWYAVVVIATAVAVFALEESPLGVLAMGLVMLALVLAGSRAIAWLYLRRLGR
jgi:hypothetical protein